MLPFSPVEPACEACVCSYKHTHTVRVLAASTQTRSGTYHCNSSSSQSHSSWVSPAVPVCPELCFMLLFSPSTLWICARSCVRSISILGRNESPPQNFIVWLLSDACLLHKTAASLLIITAAAVRKQAAVEIAGPSDVSPLFFSFFLHYREVCRCFALLCD